MYMYMETKTVATETPKHIGSTAVKPVSTRTATTTSTDTVTTLDTSKAKWFKNLSSVTLKEAQESLLARKPNFTLVSQ